MMTTTSPEVTEYNHRILFGREMASTWRTANPGLEEYMLRISGKHGITLTETFWFASAQERGLWVLAHLGNAQNPNTVQAEPQFLAHHINGWSNPEGVEVEVVHLDTCPTHRAVLTPTLPGEPGLECGMCIADHDAQG